MVTDTISESGGSISTSEQIPPTQDLKFTLRRALVEVIFILPLDSDSSTLLFL
ncbi:MAG: hypothetical protein M3299_12300 [Thermoproteota archaeon]|nr:hypothetical protein [Thermoproteota archaeon]